MTKLPIVLAFLISASGAVADDHSIQYGDFYTVAAVDAEDPRDEVLDTFWYPASWSSPTDSAILWGRDYAPDGVVEGVVRLLDNTHTRIRSYTLSFATLTPRLTVSLVCSASDCWLMASQDGVMVAWPILNGSGTTLLLNDPEYDLDGALGEHLLECAFVTVGGTFFVQKAFDEDGFYATCFDSGVSVGNGVPYVHAPPDLKEQARSIVSKAMGGLAR